MVYFGAKEWDAPLSICDMMEEAGPLREFVQDYKAYVLTPKDFLNEEPGSRFKTDLDEVMRYIAASSDKRQLYQLTHQNSAYETMRRSAAEVLNAVTRSNIEIRDHEEVVNMCKALDDLIEDGREEGRKEGRKDAIRSMLLRGKTPSEIVDFCGYPLDFVMQIADGMKTTTM